MKTRDEIEREALENSAYEHGANDMYAAEHQRISELIEEYLEAHKVDHALVVLFNKIQGVE